MGDYFLKYDWGNFMNSLTLNKFTLESVSIQKGIREFPDFHAIVFSLILMSFLSFKMISIFGNRPHLHTNHLMPDFDSLSRLPSVFLNSFM